MRPDVRRLLACLAIASHGGRSDCYVVVRVLSAQGALFGDDAFEIVCLRVRLGCLLQVEYQISADCGGQFSRPTCSQPPWLSAAVNSCGQLCGATVFPRTDADANEGMYCLTFDHPALTFSTDRQCRSPERVGVGFPLQVLTPLLP